MKRPLKYIFYLLIILALGFGIFMATNLTLRPSALAEAEHNHEGETKYTCGMHPMIIVDEPGLCPICHMELTPLKAETAGSGNASVDKGKIKYWVAPMDPTYISEEPGKSPMGMDLVPVYENEASGGTMITIDPATVQNMGVRTSAVVRGDLSRTIRTVGLVSYEESKQYVVNAKIAGWVEKLYVTETGQQVKKGQKLLDIYSPELVTAQQELLLARDNYHSLKGSSFPQISESAKRLLEASRNRLQFWDVSKKQIARLEESGKVQRTVTLYAPYGGIVTMKMVNEGMYVKPGVALLNLADLSRVWIIADIYEYQLPWVKVGQAARVVFPYVKDRILNAKISYLYPYVEAKTRTIKARIEFANPDFELRPDMYVNVYLDGKQVKDALLVPQESILYSGEKQTLFVALTGGRFEPRQVKTGLQDENGQVEILQGVFEGEQVVTSSQFMLDSESKLREAIQKMLQPIRAESPDRSAQGDDSENLFAEDEEKGKEDLEGLFN
ncbi:MAG: efflux RND transporter periplasmic adaptor subunit [Desulfuromusa sp.]|jgi:RND family efflux transporter MFP subunit|nr:efflux RND transporter periplasmic adaptor subunit [Desulfuromusa sp.]